MGMKPLRLITLAVLAALVGLGSLLGSFGEGTSAQAQECTITVQPGQSIQKAIDQVSSGAVICLAAGEWKGNLIIEKSLTLRAVEVKPQPNVVIKSAKEGWPVILIKSDKPIEVTVIGFKITGAFGGCYQYGPEWICADGISIRGQAKAVIQSTTISGNSLDGIEMRGFSQATIENNSISDNWVGIGMEDSSQATIAGSSINGNRLNGVWMGDSSQATIQNTTISGNKYDGIGIGSSSQATIEDNTIQNNSECGIRSYSDKPAQGGRNHMKGNGADLCGNLSAKLRVPLVEETDQKELSFPGPYDSLQKTIDALVPGGTILVGAGEHKGGLTIWKPLTLKGEGREQTKILGAISLIDEAQGVMIDDVAITGSPFFGLILGGRAQATIVGNSISGNEWGIGMWNSSRATIENNTISGNKHDGIGMWESPHATIRNNTISSNGADGAGGIAMLGSPKATIENNKIVNNEEYGVACVQRPCFDVPWKFEGAVRGSSNEISGNKKADVCPEDLKFLMASTGGCYGPKC